MRAWTAGSRQRKEVLMSYEEIITNLINYGLNSGRESVPELPEDETIHGTKVG